MKEKVHNKMKENLLISYLFYFKKSFFSRCRCSKRCHLLHTLCSSIIFCILTSVLTISLLRVCQGHHFTDKKTGLENIKVNQLLSSRDQNRTYFSVQSLSCVQLFVTPWTSEHQASLSITNSRSLLKLMHVHRVGDALQPSHPLSSPCPPTFNLPQHQGLFQ